jgi:hypothetical protein
MTSVGVLIREPVCVNIFGVGAYGFDGTLNVRNTTMTPNNRFSARLASVGMSRGGGRCASWTRKAR